MAFNPAMPFGHPGFGGLPAGWFGGGRPTSPSQTNLPMASGNRMGGMSPADMAMGNRFGGLAQNPMPPQGFGGQMPQGGMQPNPQMAAQFQQNVGMANQALNGAMGGGLPAGPTNVSQMMQQFAAQHQPGMNPQPLAPMGGQNFGQLQQVAGNMPPTPQGMPGSAQMPGAAQNNYAQTLLGGQSPQQGGLAQALMQARLQPLR